MKDCTGPAVGDAFGAALLAEWRGQDQTEDHRDSEVAHVFIERDDGHLDSHPTGGYFTAAGDLDPLDSWALGLATGRVLDIGCGAGRHALAVQQRGLEVVGVDPSELAVQICRERSLTAIVGGVPDLPSDLGTFDTLLLLGNNLGLLGSQEGAPDILSALDRVAAPGAQVLCTDIDPCPPGCGPPHHSYHEANVAAGRLPGQMTIRSRYKRVADPWFDYLLISLTDLEFLLADSVWEVRDTVTEGGRYAARLSRRTSRSPK